VFYIFKKLGYKVSIMLNQLTRSELFSAAKRESVRDIMQCTAYGQLDWRPLNSGGTVKLV